MSYTREIMVIYKINVFIKQLCYTYLRTYNTFSILVTWQGLGKGVEGRVIGDIAGREDQGGLFLV